MDKLRAYAVCFPEEGEWYCSEKEAEIARLTTERDAAIARAESNSELIAMREKFELAAERNVELEARAERAERVAIAVGRGEVLYFKTIGAVAIRRQLIGEWIDCDGTDADLYRALVEACEGGRE